MRITPCHQWEPRSLGLSLGVGWEWGILASLRVLKWCSMAFPTNAILGCFSDQSRLHNHQACFNARCGEVGGQEQQAFDAAEVNPEEALRVRKDVKNLGARSCSQMMNASTLMHVATCELIFTLLNHTIWTPHHEDLWIQCEYLSHIHPSNRAAAVMRMIIVPALLSNRADLRSGVNPIVEISIVGIKSARCVTTSIRCRTCKKTDRKPGTTKSRCLIVPLR